MSISAVRRMQAALLAFSLGATALGSFAAEERRTFEYNERHQLLEVRHVGNPALDVTFTYDANGNRTSKTQGGSTTIYRWDGQNRLAEVHRDGNWIARYAYDAEGRRVEKVVNGSPSPRLTRYVWDGRHVVRETNAVGDTLATHEWHGDRLLTSKRDGQRFYYLHDALGSIVIESATDGGLYARYSYDAWGNPTRTFGNQNNPHLFTGYPLDDETGLHYANARYYDSHLGAFLSTDPAQGKPADPVTFHPYLYARGNPLIYVDPDGRTAELQHVIQGFERNRQTVVGLAEELKASRKNAGWLQRHLIDYGLAGTALLNAANYVGEGVTVTANAGANIALSFADRYVVDLGRGANAANQELDDLYAAVFPAAHAATEQPLDATARAARAFADPYVRAYEGDTRSQLDVVANLDPRRAGRRIFNAMAGPEGPRIGGSQAATVVEGSDGQPAFRPESPTASVAPNPACFGTACTNNYRETFFQANPELRGEVVVHHAVEQQAMRRRPSVVREEEVHSLENLRGIPKADNPALHLSKLRVEWNRFYEANPNFTKEQLLQKATELDDKYGHQFLPPVRPQGEGP